MVVHHLVHCASINLSPPERHKFHHSETAMASNIEFPNNRSILWDRTLISGVHCIDAVDVIPPLHISAVSISSILEELESTETAIERRALIQHIGLVEDHQSQSQFHHRSIIGSHTSIFKIDANFFDHERQNCAQSESCLTIPIFRRQLSDCGLSFEKDSTL